MTSRTRSVAVLLVALLGLGFALAACGGDEDDDTADEAAAPKTLRVGYGYDLDATGVGDRVAFDRVQEQTGIQVKHSVLGSPRNTIVALERGDIDIARPGLYSFLEAHAQGAKMRLIMVTGLESELVLVGKGATTIDELRGKRIGYHLDNDETEIFVKLLLERAGLETKDAKLVSLPESPNRAAALVGNRLDAAVLELVDFIRIAQEEPDVNLIADARGVFPFPVVRVNVVREEETREQRDFLQQVVDQLVESYEFLYTDEGHDAWVAKARETALEEESDEFIEQMYTFYRDVGMWPRRDDVVSEQEWERGMKFRLDEGLLEPPLPSFSEAVDVSFWKQAASK
jgi:ABC-type nitrate/sulfonate/bicarbonate transport system substrate-binding protein